MANIFRIRRRATGQAAGAPSTLKSAELAYNMSDETLYIGYGDDGAGNATSVKAFAKSTYQDPSGLYQPKDADLDAISALDATTGLLVRSGAGAFLRRSLAGTAGRTTVTNADGTAGNPTVDLATVTVGGVTTGGYTKFTVDAYGRITNASQQTLNDNAIPTANFAMGGFTFTGLADPTNPQDAATKNYVDSVAMGMDPKASVRAATTANITLTGAQTIDGISVVAGDRVLVKNQTTASQNGIYLVATGAWTRTTDFDSWAEIPGALVAVEEGTTLADSLWLSTANQGGTLNTTPVTWGRMDAGAAGGFTIAGNGLTSAGSTISALASTGIAVSGAGIALTGQALALHNVATAADQLIYATGSGTFSATAFTAFGRSLVDDVDAATARGTLGLGTMATQSAAAVAITGGTIDGITLDGGTF